MTTTYTSYQLVSQNISKSLERVAEQPDVARETEYYLANIGKVKSVDDFMSNTRLYNYALKAHGLEDMTYAKALIRKAMTEGVTDKDSFANRLADNRYSDLVKSINFETNGENATIFESATKGVVEKYKRQTLEETAGADNTGVRLALYFERTAPTITSGMDIVADEALARVYLTAFDMPDAFIGLDVDKQAAHIEKTIDIKSLQDPGKLGKLLERFTVMWELKNPSETYQPLSVFGASVGSGISTDLLLSINSLKLGGK